MNQTYKPKDRRVVPNWRYYEATLAAGELNNWKTARRNEETYDINNYVELWNEHHSIYRAGDLISAAITNGKEDEVAVKNAATYVLEKESFSTRSLLSSARKVLGIGDQNHTQSRIEIDRLKECTATTNIIKFIHETRQRLQMMPYNPFLYVDLSRAYLLLGQISKAKDAIENALKFGATDRFVARSAARFFLHLKDKDRACEVIRAKGAVAFDPWLMASEISINMLRDKTSSYVKKGYSLIESGNCSPFGFTELASSIGTLELVYGSNRKSNKLFRKALIEPNDNSLAQVQWANSFDPISIRPETPILYDYEVKTFDALAKCDYYTACHEAVSWICDMPFAHKPIYKGYFICTNYLHNFELALAILEVGLRNDPSRSFLLNNKAYCCARLDDLVSAQKAFEKLIISSDINDDVSWRVCIPATEGLILYRSNRLEEGATKYNEALKIAQSISEVDDGPLLYKKAFLNYCRERLIAKDGDPQKIKSEVESIAVEHQDNVELKALYEEFTVEYKKLGYE